MTRRRQHYHATPQVYDYVIVGGGAAGCVVASRLSEDPGVRVLLLEAGGKNRSVLVRMPAAGGFVLGQPQYDWALQSVPQPGLNGRRLAYPRGKGLGGSTAINGMIYVRGNPRDFDDWRDQGLPGWGWRDLLPYFKRSEGNARGDDGFHSADGPLRTTAAPNLQPLDKIFLQAAAQAGLPFNPDINGRGQLGAGVLDVMVHRGQRQSAAATYLAAAQGRPNLTVMTGAHATAITLDGRRASGVRFDRDGQQHEVAAAREVLLALGSFGSPQLLLLSGIGPPEEITRHGIALRHALRGVGRNLQDHPNVAVQYDCLDPKLSIARYLGYRQGALLAARYLLAGKGPGAAPFWSTAAFVATDGAPRPDLQLFFTPMLLADDQSFRAARGGARRFDPAALLRGGKRPQTGFQFDINQLRPAARGTVTLTSPDPFAPPAIDPRFLLEAQDVSAAIAGVRLARRVAQQAAFDICRGEELWPGPATESDEEILVRLRDHVTTGHHPVGTCRMGPEGDPEAVLDERLRVRGLEGLRVVDASLFPIQVSGNPTAAVVAAAEKAADLIRDRSPQFFTETAGPLRQ